MEDVTTSTTKKSTESIRNEAQVQEHEETKPNKGIVTMRDFILIFTFLITSVYVIGCMVIMLPQNWRVLC